MNPPLLGVMVMGPLGWISGGTEIWHCSCSGRQVSLCCVRAGSAYLAQNPNLCARAKTGQGRARLRSPISVVLPVSDWRSEGFFGAGGPLSVMVRRTWQLRCDKVCGARVMVGARVVCIEVGGALPAMVRQTRDS